jgi:glycosyltransferase involved in cell wall biosynthesis
MKALIVISEAPPIKSGVARVAKELKEGLSQKGHKIDLLSLSDIPRIERGELRLSSMVLHLPELTGRLDDYDVINLHGPAPTFSDIFLLYWLIRGLRKRPFLIYTHHAPVDLRQLKYRLVAPLYNSLHNRLVRFADHVVVTTPSYGQQLSRHVPPERLSVVPWGVHHERYAGSLHKPEPFTVVFLGQIRPYKGLPVLLKAAEGLASARFWIIGNGHQVAANHALAQRMGLENVEFLGTLPDKEVVERLQKAHSIVLPSVTRSEAFGIALLEGMAAGCVPVASYLPGVADLVGNEGVTFPPGDARSLRVLLQRLNEDVEYRSNLGRLAQVKAQLYSWERVIFEYDRVLRHLYTRGSQVSNRSITARSVSNPAPGAPPT